MPSTIRATCFKMRSPKSWCAARPTPLLKGSPMRIDRPKRKLEAVGLTPLIDMIFLLLLFFLLGSDFVRFSQSQL
ncbi:MAG: biopolymer transporter ExbD, partial [Pseudomonadota bacterium]|nr:biopolymer transporter ExbD [Pseudomonadota bacterium]